MVFVNQQAMMQDIGKLKSVLVKRTDSIDSQLLFESKLHSTVEDFEVFCQKLTDDQSYRDLFVSI